jgi:hypothetical protein
MFWVTTIGVIVVATGTGISAYMAYLTQRQVGAAVGQLRAANSQLKLTERQLIDSEKSSAASDRRQDAQVAANMKVAEAAQAQAEATRQSAAAAIRAASASAEAANAQRRMADTTEKSQRPKVTLHELQIGGFKAEPDNTGLVPITVSWRFNNTGGGSFKVKQVEWGLWIGDALPARFPKGTVTPGFDYVIVNSLTSGLSLQEPLTFHVTGDVRSGVEQGRNKVFFFARMDYDDGVTGDHRTKCFGEEVVLKAGSSIGFRPSGGRAYQCETGRQEVPTTDPAAALDG